VIVTRLAGSFAILPDTGGSFVEAAAGATPTDVAWSADGKYAYLTHQGAMELGRVTLSVPAVTSALTLPFHPFRVRRSHDGTRLYVTGDGDSVMALDLATGSRVDAYGMEVDQNGLAETADGSKLYASSQSAGTIREITVATGVVGRSFPATGFTQEVVLGRGDSVLFAASESHLAVQVWSLSTGTLTDSIPVGRPTFGMALSPDGKRLYVTAPSAGLVFVLDPAARAVLDSLPVGGTPRRVAFNARGTRAVVANENGWVDFIE
jgi:YVTN family beta-propeller protein